MDQPAALAASPLSPFGGDAMQLRFCRLLAIAAFVSCFIASAQTLAQIAYITNDGREGGVGDHLALANTQRNVRIGDIFVGPGGLGVAMSPDGSRF
jgi:hypothetical protein